MDISLELVFQMMLHIPSMLQQVLQQTQVSLDLFLEVRPPFLLGGQTLHTSAFYAYAIDDITLANAVANEILAIVNTNDFTTPFWNASDTLRWDSDNSMWIQSGKM